MKKIFSFLLLFSLSLSASYLYQNENICIENFYFDRNRNFLYQASHDSTWYLSGNQNVTTIAGYVYDSNSTLCSPSPAIELGLTPEYYNFLFSFIGILFGSYFMFSMNNIFIGAGKTK